MTINADTQKFMFCFLRAGPQGRFYVGVKAAKNPVFANPLLQPNPWLRPRAMCHGDTWSTNA